MYRLGCCIPGASFMPQTGGEGAYAYDALTRGCRHILDIGFDFAEATVGTLLELSEVELMRAVTEGLSVEVCNSFVPPSLSFSGTKRETLYAYVEKAMRRMRLLGTEYVVLGSGHARNIPDGTPENERLSDLRISSASVRSSSANTVLRPFSNP